MAFDNTITEQDLDPRTQQYLQGLTGDSGDREPDLDVDGLSVDLGSLIKTTSLHLD